MARRPNYGQERAERQRKKAARREERLAAKSERRQKNAPPDDVAGVAPETLARPAAGANGAVMPVDRVAMLRIGNALKFLCGADHPTTRAVQRAAETGADDDVDHARSLFMQLSPGNQSAALTLAGAGAPR